MDYVSAVGLASSVITFVEFAWNLIAGAVETYRSVDGTLAENARLDDVKDDLDYLTDLLDKRLTGNGKTKAERRIARVAADCHADSKELQSLLGEIAGPKGNRAVWRSLKASWMNLIKRKDVAELKTRLQEHRSVVLLQVTLLLSEEQSSLNRGIAKIRDDCSELKIGFRTQITSTRNKILDAIDTLNECTSRGQETNDSSLSLISKLLLNIHTVINDTHIHHRILRQLVFEEMDSRASQIPKAAQETYHWTVEDGPSNAEDQRRGVWKLFLEWLRMGQRILHVSGNPGSGKSTLMKFLSQHERTQQELQVWAAPKTLVFGVFHFWNPGSRMQRSLTGLYRSLLFQALSQCPELTEEVFPVQFRRMKASNGDKTVEKIHHFDEDSIENGLKLLLNKAITGPYRICFFIDGLDECEGNRLHHEGLAEMFQGWITSGSIKICVSSRPYLEFIRSLNHPGNRLIQLHELNKSDITAYCLGRLGNDVYARERGDVCRRLVRIVVEHAQGVFLWVHLVVDILLVGFRQDDPDSVLEAQLNALPSDLDMLYTKLREPIEADKIQRARANRMLLLAARNPSHLSLTSMAFSWLEGQESDNGGLMGPNFPACGKMKPYSEEEIAKRLDHVTKQIDGLARGFLEIQRDDEVLRPWGCTRSFFAYRVQFCHRTARDYLLDNEHRRRSLLDSFPDFEQSQPYAKIFIAEAIYGWHSKSPAGHDVFAMFDQLFRQNIDPNLIARWEVSLRESLTPTDVTLDPTSPAVDTDPDSSVRQQSRPDQVLFLEYAAFCGLNRYVLRELTTDTTRLSGVSTTGNILLSAVKGLHLELASTLLTMSQEVNSMCSVLDRDTGVRSLVPACVIILAYIFQELIEFGLARKHQATAWLNFTKNLLKFSHGLSISMWATVREIDIAAGDDTSAGTLVRVSLADAIMLFETNTDGINEFTTVSPYSWAIDKARQISSDRDIRADTCSDGADTMQWPRQRPEQPPVQLGHGTKMAHRVLHLDKIEWSSGSQELRVLKGWTRLY